MTARIEVFGKLVTTPTSINDPFGQPSVRAQLEYVSSGRRYTASLIAMDPGACHMLKTYRRGDRLTVKGEAVPRTWNDRGGREVRGIGVTVEEVLP